MTPDHDSLREALGAYTVDALDPVERTDVERHLLECGDCRDEVASLAPLPPLLGRLTADEAEGVLHPPASEGASPPFAAMEHEQRRLRRALRAWRLAAVAAAAALVVVLLPFPRGESGPVYEPRPVVAEAADTEGRVLVTPQSWGMRVTLDVQGLPPRRGYGLWAVDGEGHRSLAASWSSTGDGSVRLVGACYVSVDELTVFELKDPDDEVLLTFEDPAR